MALWHLLLIAALQGVTEFLPISSSGHLILLPALTGIDDQGIFVDVAVHVGTLAAVIFYFRSDVADALRGTVGLLKRQWGPNEKLAATLAIATVPVVIAGLLLKLTIGTDALRSVAIIGWMTLIFGVVLWVADKRGPEVKTSAEWGIKDGLIMGCWQILALIPGVSRSGITVTGARFLGYERHEAARVAMLMSIPTIIASGAILSLDVVAAANWPLLRDALIAAVFAGLAALIALHLMLKFLDQVSFTPYVIYRVILGVLLLIWAYS